jgi:hypothetical protein
VLPPERCRAVSDKVNCVTLHLVRYIVEFSTMHGHMNVKLITVIMHVCMRVNCRKSCGEYLAVMFRWESNS